MFSLIFLLVRHESTQMVNVYWSEVPSAKTQRKRQQQSKVFQNTEEPSAVKNTFDFAGTLEKNRSLCSAQ
jgi:hypothetical protein